MKKRINILLVFLVLAIIGCSNGEVKESYKKQQYALIRGMNAFQEGKYSLAIDEYLKAYKIDKTDIFTMKQLAITYSKLNDFENSERFYKKILDIDSKDSITLYNLSVLYYNQKKYRESLKLLENISIESVTNEIRKMIGFNYYRLEELDNAYGELSIIKDFMLDDVEFAKVYSEVLLKLGKLGELHPYISKLYKENPSNYEVVYIYGRHLSENVARKMEAEDLYRNYIIDYGSNKYIVLELARLYYLRAEYNEARKIVNLIPEKLKYDVDVLKMELKIYDKLGKKTKVIELKELLKKVEKD